MISGSFVSASVSVSAAVEEDCSRAPGGLLSRRLLFTDVTIWYFSARKELLTAFVLLVDNRGEDGETQASAEIMGQRAKSHHGLDNDRSGMAMVYCSM